MGKRLTFVDFDGPAIAARYRAGESGRAIARSFGVSPALIVKILKVERVETRRGRALAQTDIADLIRRFRQGQSILAIHKATGTSQGTISQHLKAAGIQVNRPGRGKSIDGPTEADIERRMLQPATTRCASCPKWKFVGTVQECSGAFEEHRRERHPAS